MTEFFASAGLQAGARRSPPPTFAVLACVALLAACARQARSAEQGAAPAGDFPPELVEWSPAPANPVFTAAGDDAWDRQIRERGWILRDGDQYRLWYTGFNAQREGVMQLGYATSSDGVHWTRSAKNPLCPDHWIEDMMVVNHADGHFMFAEGQDHNDAVFLTSQDGVDWHWRGSLDVRTANGVHEVKKPCGTPTAWVENGVWYLFYEYRDLGIWLATTKDPLSRVWINVQDEPVLELGPGEYDGAQIALNQIIKRDGVYYAFYHGCGATNLNKWNTNIARSTDLVHWEKFPGNPLLEDKSSGIVVPDALGYRLYAMHSQVELFTSRIQAKRTLDAPRESQSGR